MKIKTPNQAALPAAILLLVMAFAWRSFAPIVQHIYTVDWYKVAGGGGTSTGGVYSVSGTIGQPDANSGLTGDRYGLVGGYWAMFSVVPTPGASLLTITLTPTNTAMVSWPSPSTGWGLRQNTNVATTNWVTPTETVTDNGILKYIIVNPPTGNRYYRLQH